MIYVDDAGQRLNVENGLTLSPYRHASGWSVGDGAAIDFVVSNCPDLALVSETPQPSVAGVVITGWHVENGTQVWETRPETAREAITRLEGLETKRRIAEAMPDDAGGTAEGRAWLSANRAAIAALRAGL